jgi:hypothetical protein
MEEKSLRPKIDPQEWDSITMCELGNRDKESITTEDNIRSFSDRISEMNDPWRREELPYLS